MTARPGRCKLLQNSPQWTNTEGALKFAIPPDELYVLSVPSKRAGDFYHAAVRPDWVAFWDLVDTFSLKEPACPNANLFWAFWCYLIELGAPDRSLKSQWWPRELRKILSEQSIGIPVCLATHDVSEFHRFLTEHKITARHVRRVAEHDHLQVSKNEAVAVLQYVHQLLDIARASSDRFLVALVNRRGEGW